MANSPQLNQIINRAEVLSERIYLAEGILAVTPFSDPLYETRVEEISNLTTLWEQVIAEAESLAANERGAK